MNRFWRNIFPACGLIAGAFGGLFGGSFCGTAAQAVEKSSVSNVELEARQLIAKLGSDEFAERERTSDDLTKLGFAAASALEEGTKHTDREVRYRCQRILLQIRQLDFEKRLEAFLNDTEEEGQVALPGWDRFRKRFGSSTETRSLFVQMQRSEPNLLKAVQSSGRAAAKALGTRVTALQQAAQAFPQEQPVGSVATILFVCGESDVTVPMQVSQMVYSLCYQQGFRNAITAGGNKESLRKMLGAWIRRGEDWVAYQALMMAMQYDLPDGLIPAEKALKQAGGQTHVRPYAILTVARFGNDSHRDLLLKMLDDKTVCTTWQMNNITIQTQVRDVAMAALLHMHKQDLKQFGFDRAQKQNPYLYNPSSLGFENEDKRIVATKKWKEFQEGLKKAAG